MQGIASAINETAAAARPASEHSVAGSNSAYPGYQIIRRNGAACRHDNARQSGPQWCYAPYRDAVIRFSSREISR